MAVCVTDDNPIEYRHIRDICNLFILKCNAVEIFYCEAFSVVYNYISFTKSIKVFPHMSLCHFKIHVHSINNELSQWIYLP